MALGAENSTATLPSTDVSDAVDTLTGGHLLEK